MEQDGNLLHQKSSKIALKIFFFESVHVDVETWRLLTRGSHRDEKINPEHKYFSDPL